MSLIGTYILPHPPIIIPEIGKGEEIDATKTIESAKKIARDISQKKPNTIIVITPHGPVFDDAVCISTNPNLQGDFKRFGRYNLRFEFENNVELVRKIINNSSKNGILIGEINENLSKQYNVETEIDHGTLVPLYFVNQEYTDYNLVHISMGFLPYCDLYKFGMSINSALEQTDEKVVVIASADLSHRLLPTSNAGYSANGKKFDQKLISLIKEHDVESIFEIDVQIIEDAGECGLRPIIILQGIMDGYQVEPNVLSYEGPFGVGYSVVKYDIDSKTAESKYPKILDKIKARIEQIRSKEDQYIKLARSSLEEYVATRRIISIPDGLKGEIINQSAGVFVSIKKHNKLRGCIGTISPTRQNIAEEIIYNAISAGTRDSRFPPVEANELNDLIYSVDILGEPEPINSKSQLDVYRYGVIVRSGNKSGLLLPNLAGIDTVEEQIDIAMRKAGISRLEKYTLERFEVIRHDTK